MKKIFQGIWRVISSPFRAAGKFITFLVSDPPDRPVIDVFADAVNKPGMLVEHFQALRKHLFRMLIAMVLGVGLVSMYASRIIDYLSQPVGGITKLQAIDVTESISVFMRVALIGGFALVSPYLAFEIWLFAVSGLRKQARILGLIGIPLATILLLCGMAFAYYVMMPAAMPFLLNFLKIPTIPRPSSYINFVTGLMFWLGVSFEFPLVIFVLTLMGIVKPSFLARQWRIAVIVIAVIAAAVTPTVDPVNMALMMAPMILLYFLSIGMSALASLGRRKSTPAA